jgi:hypothetical protein
MKLLKSTRVMWIIVAVSTAACFVLGCLLFLTRVLIH